MMNLHCIRESDHAWKALGRIHLAANVLVMVQPASVRLWLRAHESTA